MFVKNQAGYRDRTNWKVQSGCRGTSQEAAAGTQARVTAAWLEAVAIAPSSCHPSS